jgi:hypothetical protein
MPILPDTKDWTWVLNRPCAECGFEASEVAFDAIPERTRDAAKRLALALRRDDASIRPSESTWSALEYTAHVRDVCQIFRYRLDIAVSGEGVPPDVPAFDGTQRFDDGVPLLSNWNQDQTAEAARYAEQQPSVVAAQVVAAAEAIAEVIESVTESERSRIVRRSDGAQFTVVTLAQYFLHDLVHHVHDVRG